MTRLKSCLIVGAVALSIAVASFAPAALPIALAIGGVAVAGLALSLGVPALFAVEPFQWLHSHPRSIFETRRAGLA